VPELRGASEVAVLPGGLTNANYRVTGQSGSFVVRLPIGESGGLLAIDRDNEHHNSVAAAEVGIGAPVIAYLREHGVLVLGYVDGVTQTAEDLRRGDRLDDVATACRRLHGARRFARDFDMFVVQRAYLELVRARGFRLPDGYLGYEPLVRRIEGALQVRFEGTVPCNNDLLAENFIDVGDGFRLIDYEYSGNNDACFELGNVWSESNLALEQLEQLVGAYYGRPLVHKVARARLLGLMSKYGWTLWASIQDAVSPIDFDFWSWGMEKYERAVLEFEGPDLERLLVEAVRSD
jgi:thiamine kinase-like enzyme